MSEIPKEIMDKIEKQYPTVDKYHHNADALECKRQGAIFGYHLRDEQIEILKETMVGNLEQASKLIQRIKELEENEQINLNALTNAVDISYELTEQLQQKDKQVKELEEMCELLKIEIYGCKQWYNKEQKAQVSETKQNKI